jgi:hypothetical protein
MNWPRRSGRCGEALEVNGQSGCWRAFLAVLRDRSSGSVAHGRDPPAHSAGSRFLPAWPGSPLQSRGALLIDDQAGRVIRLRDQLPRFGGGRHLLGAAILRGSDVLAASNGSARTVAAAAAVIAIIARVAAGVAMEAPAHPAPPTVAARIAAAGVAAIAIVVAATAATIARVVAAVVTEPTVPAVVAARIVAGARAVVVARVAIVAAGVAAGVATVIAARIAAATMEMATEPTPPAVARVIAAVVITTATTRRRCRRSGRTRRGTGVGAREPGRCYQQESSIHDCTSLWDFRPKAVAAMAGTIPPQKSRQPAPVSFFQAPRTCNPGMSLGAYTLSGLCHLLSAPGRRFFNRFTKRPQPTDFSISLDPFPRLPKTLHFPLPGGRKSHGYQNALSAAPL